MEHSVLQLTKNPGSPSRRTSRFTGWSTQTWGGWPLKCWKIKEFNTYQYIYCTDFFKFTQEFLLTKILSMEILELLIRPLFGSFWVVSAYLSWSDEWTFEPCFIDLWRIWTLHQFQRVCAKTDHFLQKWFTTIALDPKLTLCSCPVICVSVMVTLALTRSWRPPGRYTHTSVHFWLVSPGVQCSN